MTHTKISAGVVHDVPGDLEKLLINDRQLLEKWNDLTALARNEWICWIISVKKSETRKFHIKRLREKLIEGIRRPCCWPGCPHRSKK